MSRVLGGETHDDLMCPWIGEVTQHEPGVVRLVPEAEESPGMAVQRDEQARELGLALYERRRIIAEYRARKGTAP